MDSNPVPAPSDKLTEIIKIVDGLMKDQAICHMKMRYLLERISPEEREAFERLFSTL